jgi:hypothetical protein
MNPFALFNQAVNYVRTTAMGKVILVLVILVLFLIIVLPLLRKLKRRRVKEKETREIMKDLLTWRHLAQLVKGGGGHEKAKQELSDNLVKINDLLKQGFHKFAKRERDLYMNPWFILLGEPRSGKSSLLEASDLELEPSEFEKEPSDDGKGSLPVRFWNGTKAVVCDISGRVFFDRWLEGSSAEWNYIVKQICRYRRKKPFDGLIITIPADALLADDETLSSNKAILMANELNSLLLNSGMNLPCYVMVTKLDMVNGFRDYTKFIEGDLRHQIFGFENAAKHYNKEKFDEFWEKMNERLGAGAKQLIAVNARKNEQTPESRMDTAAKIWTFSDNLNALGANLRIYLNALFGEEDYHGTGRTFFEGLYFCSAKDTYISLSPGMAALSGLTPDGLIIPGVSYTPPVYTEQAVPANAAGNTTLLMPIPSRQLILAPVNRKPDLTRGYFIRDVFHKRIFRFSEHAFITKRKALQLHLPHYALCAVLAGLGFFFGLTALLNDDNLYTNLLQPVNYYSYLDGLLQKGSPFYSPLVKEDPPGKFFLDTEPVAGEALSSRVQFFYNAVAFRDMNTVIPAGFRLSRTLTDGIQPNYRYRDKAFITNQLYAAMVRMPVIRNVGNKIVENAEVEVLTADIKAVLSSFLELDGVKNVEFHKLFRSGGFKFEPMLRYLIPEISNDTVHLLNQYKERYVRDYSYSIDVNYIYSDDFAKAKDAALNTIISAWRRYAVYPDSIYGKIKRLASISEEIIANDASINNTLRRINTAVNLGQVREVVYEWKGLTNRQKSIIAEGRAIFAEIKEQLRAAHIPLAFETSLPSINIGGSGGAILTSRPAPDAYRDNLINDYLFNDMVIGFAVKEYTALFEADMSFVRQKLGPSGQERAGQIIALEGEFGNKLTVEVQNLRTRAARLQDNELLADKTDEQPDSPSLFSVVEKILELSSDIALPPERIFSTGVFETSWQEGQSSIKAAFDEFDAYTGEYLENKKVKTLISNARNMLLAQAFLNRYTIFTTTLDYLYTFESNIAGIVLTKAGSESAVSFSDNALEKTLGISSYNRTYDPFIVKQIVDNVVSFASLFVSTGNSEELPAFLRNVPPDLYKPEAFMRYLTSYIRYWGRYPDIVYIPQTTWSAYRDRIVTIKAFQINAALQTIYAKSMEAINIADNTILSSALAAEKDQYITSLSDKFNVLSQFLSTDAERMVAAWTKLPEDPLDAFRTLQGASEEELTETYLPVYTVDSDLAIGWWNDFAFNGIRVLSDEFKRVMETTLMSQLELLKQYPLCTDAPVESPLSLNNVKDLASLLGTMGAGITAEETDPVKQSLHPALFKGSAAPWARKIYQFAEAAADSAKPLTWTISQPPIDTQARLPSGGRLLASNRFRYIEVRSANKAAARFSTYMNQKLTLAEGYSDEGNIIFRFFRTSEDLTPQATVVLSNKWAAFNLYFQKDTVKAADNNNNEVVYVPVYVPADGTQYVYFVELSFNREIPLSDEWNTVRTMPDLVIQDGFVVGRSFSVD